LFPHEPKVKVVRKRGVRKLVKEEGFAIPSEEEVEMEEGDLEGMPVAELEAGNSEDVITYKTSRGQRREYSTSTRPRIPILTPFQRRHMSARPESMPNTAPTKTKVTLNTLRSLAASKTPITCLTAYDFPTALLSETAGIDMVLVGDSLSQVALGQSSTTQITLDEMIHHAKAVTRGAKTPFVFADMPFGSFEQSLEVGVGNVIRMIKESGVDGVKIEGGREIVPLVRRLSSIGIPIIPHLGLQPQRATSLSGYLVQGKTTSAAIELFNTAKELHEAGATGFVLEAIPQKLATYISSELNTITIGIGAGSGTHAQVLVITDVLGLYEGEGARPKFVRGFGRVGEAMREAVEGYRDGVKSGGFPEMGKETYGMKKEEWEGFLKAREGSEL
jgi:3-methyl-2-oxobutanoate hydroxymethyltransferase